MKRKLLTIVIAVLLLAGIAYAGGTLGWVKHTSTQTASASITTSSGYFHGILFVTDGSTSNTVNVYDNASGAASGDKLLPTNTVITTAAANRLTSISFAPPIRFYNGLYVTVSSTIEYMVYYEDDSD